MKYKLIYKLEVGELSKERLMGKTINIFTYVRAFLKM